MKIYAIEVLTKKNKSFKKRVFVSKVTITPMEESCQTNADFCFCFLEKKLCEEVVLHLKNNYVLNFRIIEFGE